MEGPPFTSYDSNAVVDYWWKDSCTPHRVNQNSKKLKTTNHKQEMNHMIPLRKLIVQRITCARLHLMTGTSGCMQTLYCLISLLRFVF